MRLSSRVAGRSYRFRDLNDLLAKSNRERSGDRLAGLAAKSTRAIEFALGSGRHGES